MTDMRAPGELPLLHLPNDLSQFTSRILEWHDLDMVLTFRQQIFAVLPREFRMADPECDDLVKTELDWANTHLRHPAVTLGIFNNTQMIAFASLLLPDTGAGGDISRLMGMSNTEIDRSAHMAACMVAEDFRGLRMQSRLLAWRRAVAVQAGRSLLVSMTACGNMPSLRNMIDAGMSIRWVGEFRPKRWWQVVAKDLQPGAENMHLAHHVWVKADDYPRQAALTAEGFEGLAEISRPGRDGKLCAHFEFAQRVMRVPTASNTSSGYGLVDNLGEVR